jgi:hypothetical protein
MFRLSDVELQTNGEAQPDKKTPLSKTLQADTLATLGGVVDDQVCNDSSGT